MKASPLRKLPLAENLSVSPNPVAALVQELIQQAAITTTKLSPQAAEQEIILDVEVDGVRCLLVRTRPHLSGHSALSPRELEIARMVATGYPNKIIADVLEISEWTVGTHLRRIFAKLGVGSRAAMVSRLIEEGVLCEYTGRIKSA